MESHRSAAAAVLVALELVAVGSLGAAADSPRPLRVALDNAYAPYSFRADDGTLRGVLVDEWHAWERQTGLPVEIHAMDWGEALRLTGAGELDVIDSIVETPERRRVFDFTRAYAIVEASIFFRSDISGITDLASLRGFPVGVKRGDQHVDALTASGVTTVVPFASNDEIVQAARQRKINVFVADAPSAVYLLNKRGIEADFRHSGPIFRDELRRAVRRGDTKTLSAVSKGFAAIDPHELAEIQERWFGRPIYSYRRYLSYAGYGGAVAMLVIAGLGLWNRSLRRGVLQRTEALGQSEARFRRVAHELDASASQLHALARRLMRAQDDEQRRIARMLHETTAQDLAALKMHLARLNRTAGDLSDADRAALTESISLAEQSITEIRTLSYLLHPPFLDENGLLSALRWYAAGFGQRSGIRVELQLPEIFERLPLDTETALFRIVQESLVNIHRHAESDTARIILRRDVEALELEIQDRGHGIPEGSLKQIMSGAGGVGVGIAGISERVHQLGGRLEITSAEQGTTVHVRLPLAVEAA